jgi:hypothetical protein
MIWMIDVFSSEQQILVVGCRRLRLQAAGALQENGTLF